MQPDESWLFDSSKRIARGGMTLCFGVACYRVREIRGYRYTAIQPGSIINIVEG